MKIKKMVTVIISCTVYAILTTATVFAANGTLTDLKDKYFFKTENRTVKDIENEMEYVKKSFEEEYEKAPQNGTLNERLKAGKEFKDKLQQLAEEQSKFSTTTDERQNLQDSIDVSKDALESLVNSYEIDKSYLDPQKPDNKKDYDLAKKKLEFLKTLEEDFKNGKITATDGLKKFEKVKDIK